MTKVTIPYKSLPLAMRVRFKPVKNLNGEYELRMRFWYAFVFGLRYALHGSIDVKKHDETKLQEAAKVLRRFQDWRLGYDVRTMTEADLSPSEMTAAIDTLLAFFDLEKPLVDCRRCQYNGESQDFIGCIKGVSFGNKKCVFEEK